MTLKIYKTLVQGTPEWLEVRKGVVTGTSVASVRGSDAVKNTLIRKLSANLRGVGNPNVKNWAMQRGNDLEDVCQKEYERLTGYKVDNIGFATRTGYWGHSPDGVIYNDEGKITRAIEIKSPYGETILKYLEKDKIPSEYKWQVVNYFCVFPDLEELDFLLFYPHDKTLEKYQKKMKSVDLLQYMTGSTLEDEIFIWTVTREEMQNDIEDVENNMKEFRELWKTYEEKHYETTKRRGLRNNIK